MPSSRDFTAQSIDDIEDRILRNMCVIAAMVRLLEPEIGRSLPFTYKEFKSLALSTVHDQMSLINRSNETNVFWDMVNYLIDQGVIMEEKDYKFRKQMEVRIAADRSNTVIRAFERFTTVLYLRMTSIIPEYRKNFK